MFNLNDSRWGRSEDKPADAPKPEGAAPDNEPVKPPPENRPQSGRRPSANAGRQILMNCGVISTASSVDCSVVRKRRVLVVPVAEVRVVFSRT